MLSHQVIIIPNNYYDVWANQIKVENANRLIKQVKLCVINIYKADWSVQQSPKLHKIANVHNV